MKVLHNILFLSLGSAAIAQPNDSIFIKENENVAISKSILWEQPIQASYLNIKNYTQVGVRYLKENQNIKRVQSADETNQFEFYTEGFYQFNPKLKVFGDFKMNQFSEKGIGYNLSNERTSETNKILSPNYYYSPSKGDWKNQLYHISAGGRYEFLKNAFLGVTTKYNNTFYNRNSDPRPSNTSNLFDGTISLGYTLNKHTLVANYRYVTEKLENETYYEAANVINPSTNPDYYIKFSSGYGYKMFNSNYSKYLNKTKGNYFGASYSLKLPKTFIMASFDYGSKQTDHYMRNDNGSGITKPLEEDKFISFKAKNTTSTTTLYLNQKFDKNSFEAKATLKTNEVMNYVVNTRSRNYQLKGTALNIETLYRINENKWIKGVGLDAYLDQLNVKDLLGITEKQHTSIDFTIFAQNKFNLNKNSNLFVHFGLGAFMPLKNNLMYIAATQDQDFTNNVIKRDDVYDDTKKLNAQFMMHYEVPFQNKTIRFSGSYRLLNTLNSSNLNTQYTVKGTANYYNVGVSVIY